MWQTRMCLKSFSLMLVGFSVLLLPTHKSLADTPSTSPSVLNAPLPKSLNAIKEATINPDIIITFSEFPVDTAITNQYSDKGIIFGGDSPFITTDTANPTSPVLSGSPRFEGAIEGTFVDPNDGVTSGVVAGFSMDAGYFDALGSVRLTWYSADGKMIGQKIASTYGIQTFTVEGGAIAKWRIETIAEEPAGFAIDNVSIKPLGSELLFREDSWQGGFWGGRFFNYIPGYDHSALLVGNLVYESNIEYPKGTYVDSTGTEEIYNDNSAPEFDEGVQYYHTKNTFQWDALKGEKSTVTQNASVPISDQLAGSMRDLILTKKDAPFRYLGTTFRDKIKNLLPELQKGAVGDFTCVGLLEWAAEQSGHNSGEGFVPNDWESTEIQIVDSVDFAWPPVSFKTVRLPLLSPELLYQVTSGNISAAQAWVQGKKEWLQGFFDPIDFIITDPLGRKLGHSVANGTLQNIPGAFYSGDGLFEQFLIPQAVPGIYTIEIFGVGEDATFGIASETNSVGMEDHYFDTGEKQVMYFKKEVVLGGIGDVDGDGDIDTDDVALLAGIIPRFTNTLNDSGDLNGDGILDQNDVDLLQRLADVVNLPFPQALSPQAVPAISVWGLLMMSGMLVLIGIQRTKRNKQGRRNH